MGYIWPFLDHSAEVLQEGHRCLQFSRWDGLGALCSPKEDPKAVACSGVDYDTSLAYYAQVGPLVVGAPRRIRIYDKVGVVGETWGGVSLCLGVWVAVICLVIWMGPEEGYEWESSAQLGFIFCAEDIASF